MLFNRPDRLAGDSIKGIDPGLLGHLHHNLFAVGQVRQNRGRGVVPVPDVVMDYLVVPAALASFDVYSDQCVREKVVAGAVAAVTVTGC